MPGNVVSMQNNRMNLTNAEKEARANAESALRREEISLHIPKSVLRDSFAFEAWKRIVGDLEEIELLDNLDSDMLGIYCLTLSRLEVLNEGYDEYVERTGTTATAKAAEIFKEIISCKKILLTYAEKLGLTPTARARLAVKKAQQREADPDADLFGEL